MEQMVDLKENNSQDVIMEQMVSRKVNDSQKVIMVGLKVNNI